MTTSSQVRRTRAIHRCGLHSYRIAGGRPYLSDGNGNHPIDIYELTPVPAM